MKKVAFVAAVVAALSLAAPVPSTAQGRGHAKAGKAQGHKAPAPKAHGKGHDDKARSDVAIDRTAHARVIHEYVASGSLPPGLAKREELPPGLRKQLRERGELPPGLQKRLVDVPGPLIARLPPVPSHYHRYFAGNDLVVVDTRTNRIVSIVPDVLR